MTSCTSMTIFSVLVDKQSQFLYLKSYINCYLPVELEYFCSTSCWKKLTPSPPLLIITQMPLLNSLLNSLLKYHYSNHYSPLLKCHFHYSSLLRHYSKGTLLMISSTSRPLATYSSSIQLSAKLRCRPANSPSQSDWVIMWRPGFECTWTPLAEERPRDCCIESG